MAIENLLQYETIERWFRQLRKKASAIENGGIPIATKEKATSAILAYMRFTGMNPDEIIADAEKELREKGNLNKHNDLLDLFWDSMQTKTTASSFFAMIKSFYKRNRIPLSTATPAAPTIRQTELIPNNEQIRRICDMAPINHASWILANNYMGLRVSAFLQLTVQDFTVENWKEDKPIYPVHIRKIISGTFDYTTFIGNDAMQKLKLYFANTDPKKPWPFKSGDYMIQRFKRYAYKAGVIDAPKGVDKLEVPKGLCPLRPHSFRKRLQTILEGGHVPLNWVDYLLGHVPRGAQAKAYSRPSDQELYDAYLQCLPQLEIYGHHAQSPAMPTVELQKILALEQIQKAYNLPPEKLERIKNDLAMVRTSEEIGTALKNIMVMVKEK